MNDRKLLLTAVVGPYGVKDPYAEGLGMQIELLNNQITREQGVHSPRQAYWSFGLYLIAHNLSVPTTVLDFPTWKDFTEELRKGYTHVGISFIVPNVLKAGRMAEYIRKHHPEMKIILGGYGTVIPKLKEMVPHDEICRGEGVKWLRNYFGEEVERPIKHPAMNGPAFEYLYGFKGKAKGAILMPGLGCNNGCTFCITSHMFEKKYIPLFPTGKDLYEACLYTEEQIRARGFSIMDENFLKQPDRARELLEEMTKNMKPYVFDIFSSAEVVKELGVDFLVRLGVRMVWIGVESKVNSHAKTQGIDLAAMIQELQQKGIVVNTSAILFQDHHDETSLKEDIDWVIGLGANLTQFMNYTPYPTTSLYERYEKEGRLKNLHYRHQHGVGELAFVHPHFNDPKVHINYLRKAFRKKYRKEGPGVLNMALTAIQGYLNAEKEFKERAAKSLAWNPKSLRYEKTDHPEPDTFMASRIQKMRTIALNIRPIILPAYVFAPNKEAREKALKAFRLFREAFGKQETADLTKGMMLTLTGGMEFLRIKFNKLVLDTELIRQPPCRRTVFHGMG